MPVSHNKIAIMRSLPLQKSTPRFLHCPLFLPYCFLCTNVASSVADAVPYLEPCIVRQIGKSPPRKEKWDGLNGSVNNSWNLYSISFIFIHLPNSYSQCFCIKDGLSVFLTNKQTKHLRLTPKTSHWCFGDQDTGCDLWRHLFLSVPSSPLKIGSNRRK